MITTSRVLPVPSTGTCTATTSTRTSVPWWWWCSMLWMVCVLITTPGVALEGLEIYQPHCREALGMHSGAIADQDITASSSYDLNSVGPHLGRIRTEEGGGAWCPSRMINKDVYEYLQIDLGEIKMITLAETQGRFGNGQGQEYTEHYYLEYQRLDDGPWVTYVNRTNQQIFEGNRNTYIAELRELDPPIIARRVRFIPYSQHPRTVCMRVELYGCHWKEGIISYSMREGDKRGSGVNLIDDRYDGQKLKDGTLTGGLGQLTDGDEGLSNFRLAPKDMAARGFEWVGWKNETGDAPPVEITFTFDHVREFSEIRLHCNNYFSKDVRVFRKAEVELSVGGVYYAVYMEPVVYYYNRDDSIEYARPVIIHLPPGAVGRFVKLRLFFDSRWIMISEAQFTSVLAKGQYQIETSPRPTTRPPPTTTSDTIVYPDIKDNNIPPPVHTEMDVELPIITPLHVPSGGKKRKPFPGNNGGGSYQNKPPLGGDAGHGEDDHVYTYTGNNWGNKPPSQRDDVGRTLPDEPDRKRSFPEAYIGMIIGTVTAVILVVLSIVLYVVIRQRQHKKKSTENLDIYETKNSADMNNASYPGARSAVPASAKPLVPNYNMFNNSMTVSETDAEDELLQKLGGKKTGMMGNLGGDNGYEEPRGKETIKDTDSGRGASPLYVQLPSDPVFNTFPHEPTYSNQLMPNITTNPMFAHHRTSSTPPIQPPPPIPPPPHQHTPNTHLAHTNNAPNAHTHSSLLVLGGGGGLLGLNKADMPMELDKDWLKLVDKLGEGQFGEIHLCLIAPINVVVAKQPWVTCDRVAVKVLNNNADKRARDNFYHEALTLSQLRDPNLAQVVGVCTRSEPLCMALEYTRHGDLCAFLKRHVLVDDAKPTDANKLSYGCQLYIATQIASGMKYLEALNMVHRDLATRNCLVGDNCSIKITDLGMSRERYQLDYYRLDNHMVLPIRWMAWETVLLGKFSSKSDVWSFAVTLWEILTLSNTQPYHDLSDKSVISNCSHYFQQDNQHVILPKPHHCPKEIYDLMLECWSRDEGMRPAFREVHMFLQRKNMGYDPREDYGIAMSTKIATA